MQNKILMIVNAFPPSGESGVQRPVKFVKYLVRNGWEAYIVTPKKAVLCKNRDVTLEQDVPVEAKIFKTHSLGIRDDNLTEVRLDLSSASTSVKKLIWKVIKPFNDLFFPIDKQIGWVPFALFTSIKIIKQYKIRNIYITASPYSAFWVGVILKKIYGTKIFWVADYRDAWQFGPMLDELVLPFRKKYIVKMDEKFLKKADHVIFTSPLVLAEYQTKYPWLTGKADFITNGYDDDDFKGLQAKQFNKFTFVFMGKLQNNRGTPVPWLKVIKSFMQIDFQYVHVGIIDTDFLRQIKEEGLDFYQFIGYKTHLEALTYAAGAEINVIALNDDPDSIGVIPGKIFELIRLGKPILAIGPDNSAIKDIIVSTGTGIYAIINNEASIRQALHQLLIEKDKLHPSAEEIGQYSRQACTDKLEEIYQVKRQKNETECV